MPYGVFSGHDNFWDLINVSIWRHGTAGGLGEAEISKEVWKVLEGNYTDEKMKMLLEAWTIGHYVLKVCGRDGGARWSIVNCQLSTLGPTVQV